METPGDLNLSESLTMSMSPSTSVRRGTMNRRSLFKPVTRVATVLASSAAVGSRACPGGATVRDTAIEITAMSASRLAQEIRTKKVSAVEAVQAFSSRSIG